MIWFLRRFLQSVVVVWASVSLLFAIFFVLPGDRVEQVFGADRAVTPEARAAIVERFALDEPATTQYVNYWSNVLDGELGVSYVTGRDVADVLEETAAASLRLAFWALVVELVVGVMTGLVVAARRSRLARASSTAMSSFLLAAPVFVLGFVLQLALGVFPFQNGWADALQFPVQGIGPDTWFAGVLPTGEQWRHLLLPAVALGLAAAAVAHRVAREVMTGVMTANYVKAARARGVSERSIFWRHGVRNAAMPIATFVAVDLVALFGAAVVAESVFNWPGIGSEMADALVRGDVPVILAITIVLAITYVVVTAAVDLLHRVVDPRVSRS